MEALYRFVENMFAGLARVIYHHPIPPLLLVAAITYRLPRLR